MFSYLLSFAIAFLFFGTINSVLLKASVEWQKEFGSGTMSWILVGICSVFWFLTVPVLILILLMYLLKLLTDWIAEVILNKVEKRKQSKLLKEKRDV